MDKNNSTRKNNTNIRKDKLRNLLLQEVEQYQYEIYSNGGSQAILDKLNKFKAFNNNSQNDIIYQNIVNSNNYANNNRNYINNNSNDNIYQNNTNIKQLNDNNNYYNRNQLPMNENIVNNPNSNIPNGNTTFNQNAKMILQNYNEDTQKNNTNLQNNNIYNNSNYDNNSNSYNGYEDIDLDMQIKNCNAHYNQLKVDEFMSKNLIQNELLSKINQRLNIINKNINDKAYQENLAAIRANQFNSQQQQYNNISNDNGSNQ